MQDFERPHDETGLGYERMLLGPLDRAGIIEAIEGPARDPDLQRHYRLNVEPGLSQTIATDLEADPGLGAGTNPSGATRRSSGNALAAREPRSRGRSTAASTTRASSSRTS